MAAVCSRFEYAPVVQGALARDWQRLEDDIIGTNWHFEGTLDYSDMAVSPLPDYSIRNVSEVRVKALSKEFAPTNLVYYLENQTVVRVV